MHMFSIFLSSLSNFRIYEPVYICYEKSRTDWKMFGSYISKVWFLRLSWEAITLFLFLYLSHSLSLSVTLCLLFAVIRQMKFWSKNHNEVFYYILCLFDFISFSISSIFVYFPEIKANLLHVENIIKTQKSMQFASK